MKKILFTSFIVLALAAISQDSHAQAFEKRKLHINGGLGILNGTSIVGSGEYAFADFLGLGAAVDFNITPSNLFNLGFRGSYHFEGSDELDTYVGAQYMFTNGGYFNPHGGVRFMFNDKFGAMAEMGLTFVGKTEAQLRFGLALKL
jgi:hypothetical protein